MPEYFKQVLGLLFSNKSLWPEQIHSGSYFVGVNNSGPDIKVIGGGLAGDSHFVQISDVGAHLQFE